ncbi:DUF2182 domain-containing protein [Actinoplanes sp. NPDC024001]|uniref:DUF2182 domain-containing protein n=1 Tax=Actinoplanes sp. NPDC024001 TaxID=3154598 RepID=UPI0033D191AA
MSISPPARLDRLRRWGAWHPEWPLLAGAAGAWAVLIVQAPVPHRHGPHGLTDWALMSLAMMVPAAAPVIRYVGLNSIRSRRLLAMALFVTAYLAGWTAYGVVVLTVAGLAGRAEVAPRLQLAVVLGVAGLWQLSRWKRSVLGTCVRPVPLPPVGWRANAACARFGVSHSFRCITSSWALMLLMPSGSLWLMALLTVVAVAESVVPLGARSATPLAFVLAISCVAVVAEL